MRHCSLRRQGVKVVMVETVKPCVSAGVSVGVETSSHKHLQTAALQTSLCPKPTARGHNWETALQARRRLSRGTAAPWHVWLYLLIIGHS